jgi:chaperone BCS1
MLEKLLNLINTNQFLTGGFILGLLGGIAVYLRSVPANIFYFIKRRVVFSVEIENHYSSFHLFSYWLQKQKPVFSNKNFFLREEQKISRGIDFDDDDDNDEFGNTTGKEKKRNRIFYVPSSGLHFFKYNKKLLIVYFYRKEITNTSSSPEHESPFRYSYTVYMFGKNEECQKTFNTIIEESGTELSKKVDGKIKIRASAFINRYGENLFGWKLSTFKHPRTKETLIFDDNFYEDIENDIDKFLHNKDWYKEKGIPWRRGYLLHGVPGGGKTTLIETLAGRFNFNINILDLMNDKLTDQYLIELFASIRDNSIIVVEDIDTIFEKRTPTSDKIKITFSGLLNAIDGIASKDGQIIFMTTNNIDVLDDALKRSGRLDKHIEFDYASEQQKRKMFLKFFKEDELNANKFMDIMKGVNISMAKLQEHFVLYSYDVNAIFENIGELK